MLYNFKKEFARRRALVEDLIRCNLPRLEGEEATILKSMEYSILAGGKRLRPIILLETYRLFSNEDRLDLISKFMVAIECIHTYSLIHDDLPSMDNDSLRRGQPTNHIVFGEGMAVLTGDALLNYAMELSLEALSHCKNEEERDGIIEAAKILFRNSGVYGMISGQVLDISENDERDTAYIERLYELKTAALIRSAFLIGGVLAAATEKELELLSEIGKSFGLVFQLQDDFLDLVGDTKKLGKNTGSDEKNKKITYLSLIGEEELQNRLKREFAFLEREVSALCKKNIEYDGFILELVKNMEERDR